MNKLSSCEKATTVAKPIQNKWNKLSFPGSSCLVKRVSPDTASPPAMIIIANMVIHETNTNNI